MKQIITGLIAFRDARGWAVNHNPESLSYALACEAGELLRLWEWGKVPDVERVKEEVADVAIYALYYLGLSDFYPVGYSNDTGELVKRTYELAGRLMCHWPDPKEQVAEILNNLNTIAIREGFKLREAIT